MRFFTLSIVATPLAYEDTVPTAPVPSPYNIRPRLNFEAVKSPSISAFNKSTKAPLLLALARIALSLISIVPYKFLRLVLN